MKTFLIIALALGLVAAAPKPTKLNFRNLYGNPNPNFKPPSALRIIGGQEAVPHSIPYQAFLEVHSGLSGWYCGGSLISANYVLTAGHCGHNGKKAIVVLGAHKPQRFEETQLKLTSTEIHVHEDFDLDQIANDIALIKLPHPATLSQFIGVIGLPSGGETYTGAIGKLSGWGVTDGSGQTISSVLNFVEAPILDNEECAEQFQSAIRPSNICMSGAAKTGACSGDSGGPLAVNGQLVGVVSFGIRNCLPGYASVFTRTTSYLDWIKGNSDVVIE